MPEVKPQPRQQLVAMIMMVSSIALFSVAMLIFTGVVPLPDDVRIPASIGIGLAAAVDLVMALVFFRKGQST